MSALNPALSPLPWRLDEDDMDISCLDHGYENVLLHISGRDTTTDNDLANAAFIVTACNNHDALMAIVKRCADFMEMNGAARMALVEDAQAVLAGVK